MHEHEHWFQNWPWSLCFGKIHSLSAALSTQKYTFPSLCQQSIDLFCNVYLYLSTVHSNFDSVSYRKLGWAILMTLVQSVEKTSRLKGTCIHVVCC